MFDLIKKTLLFSKVPGGSTNICNPCFLEVPSWVKNKLGKYYMYFADHRGEYIKMAYSNDLSSGWKFKKGGVLNIKRSL